MPDKVLVTCRNEFVSARSQTATTRIMFSARFLCGSRSNAFNATGH
jgi:hypothetical protein